MADLTIEQLSYVYSPDTPFQKAAVQDVSVTIPAGDFVAVIGHTGSGKSTLIQHLNGLLRPTSGRVLLDGKDIWANPREIRAVRFRVGLVFQYPEYQLFEETVAQDIAFGPTNMGLSPAEVAERVQEAAEFVGILPEWMGKSPFELSGGQKRRVAIAGVLAMRPEVLILDEPTAGLDPMGREQILGEIARYHQKTGSTILLVSHSMEDVARYAKKVLVMNDAALFGFGTVEEIFARSEELAAIGLAVPQITRICAALAAKGYPIPAHCYTVEAATDAIVSLLAKGGRHDAP